MAVYNRPPALSSRAPAPLAAYRNVPNKLAVVCAMFLLFRRGRGDEFLEARIIPYFIGSLPFSSPDEFPTPRMKSSLGTCLELFLHDDRRFSQYWMLQITNSGHTAGKRSSSVSQNPARSKVEDAAYEPTDSRTANDHVKKP
jgi:hypothetical protein